MHGNLTCLPRARLFFIDLTEINNCSDGLQRNISVQLQSTKRLADIALSSHRSSKMISLGHNAKHF